MRDKSDWLCNPRWQPEDPVHGFGQYALPLIHQGTPIGDHSLFPWSRYHRRCQRFTNGIWPWTDPSGSESVSLTNSAVWVTKGLSSSAARATSPNYVQVLSVASWGWIWFNGAMPFTCVGAALVLGIHQPLQPSGPINSRASRGGNQRWPRHHLATGLARFQPSPRTTLEVKALSATLSRQLPIKMPSDERNAPSNCSAF